LTPLTELSNNPAVVDPIAKIQAGINAATTLKIAGRHNEALSYFQTAAQIAFYSGAYPLLFLSLIGLADIQCETANYAQAVFTLEQADYILFSDGLEPYYQLSRNINKTISEIKSIIIYIQGQKLQQLEKQMASQRLRGVFNQILSKIISTFAQLGIQYFACKKLGIKGAIGISLFGLFSFKGSSFTKTQIGDKNIMNNIERIVTS
jgi:tetratricopeptide (TPR) repeat protein